MSIDLVDRWKVLEQTGVVYNTKVKQLNYIPTAHLSRVGI